MQIVFVVETNNICKSDQKYISEIIKDIYVSSNKVKYSYVYMNGKHNYNKPGIIKKIKELRNKYSHGDTIVIYVFDKDCTALSVNDITFEKEVIEYCDNEFEIIWFNSTVEYVLYGEKISSSDKKRRADNFVRGNKIKNVPIDSLCVEGAQRNKTSNTCCILDNYLTRKE